MQVKKIFSNIIFYKALACICMVHGGLVDVTARTSGNRIQINISDGWLFTKNDTSKTNANWQKVNLPHTWNTDDVLDDIPGHLRCQFTRLRIIWGLFLVATLPVIPANTMDGEMHFMCLARSESFMELF